VAVALAFGYFNEYCRALSRAGRGWATGPGCCSEKVLEGKSCNYGARKIQGLDREL
jgi:hypothetical protein